MVLRLSELLERIRPTGAPGAPAGGDQLRDSQAATEIADITRILTRFEAETDEEISAARERADQIRATAERQVRRIRDDLPRAVADARGAGAASSARQTQVELDRIAHDTHGEIDRLSARAAELPRLVDTAMAVIREELMPRSTQGRPR